MHFQVEESTAGPSFPRRNSKYHVENLINLHNIVIHNPHPWILLNYFFFCSVWFEFLKAFFLVSIIQVLKLQNKPQYQTEPTQNNTSN